MKVRATDQSQKLNVMIRELNRIAIPDEIFEIEPERFDVLAGENYWKAVFVTEAEPNTIETATVEAKTETATATKRATRRTKSK